MPDETKQAQAETWMEDAAKEISRYVSQTGGGIYILTAEVLDIIRKHSRASQPSAESQQEMTMCPECEGTGLVPKEWFER